MKINLAVIAFAIVLDFCSFAHCETFGLGEPASSQLVSVIEPVAPVADLFGLGDQAGPVNMQEIMACPGGVCPLPRVTVTAQPVVVSQVTCPNCPAQTVSTRAMPVAAIDCPCGCGIVGCNCRAQASPVNFSNISKRSTWLESHLQLEHGIDTTGMSPADMQATHDAIHAAEGGRVVRWNGPIVRAIRNRPVLFPRLRNALFRR